MTEVRGRRRVLFVCEYDDGPSRMCAAYLAQLAGDRYEALSAGLEAASLGFRLEAAASLSEDGIPVVDGPAPELTPDLAAAVDHIVTLGFTLNPDVARDVPREEWGIPSVAGRQMQEVRVIRDTIRRLVERLVARLDTEAVVR